VNSFDALSVNNSGETEGQQRALRAVNERELIGNDYVLVFLILEYLSSLNMSVCAMGL
jgi:hypothetical protein